MPPCARTPEPRLARFTGFVNLVPDASHSPVPPRETVLSNIKKAPRDESKDVSLKPFTTRA